MYNSNTYISIPIFGLLRDASSNGYIGLGINVDSGVEAEFIVKGNVNINSNDGYGMYSFLGANTKLEINVENGSTLESCGNDDYDISGEVVASATATFSGDGSYTCDQAKVVFNGDGTVVPPNCQACPSI
jgi:hypothetical protein